MKVDTSRIDRRALLDAINEAYGLAVTSLTFVPKGEDAYSYVGDGPDRPRYFVKAQEMAALGALETALMAASALRVEASLPWVVVAYPSRSDRFVMNFAGYAVSVFPFVAGAEAFGQQLTVRCWRSLGAIGAQLHRALPALATPPRWRETFENPFRDPILRALWAAERWQGQHGGYRERARRLLLARQAEILAALEEMEQLRQSVLQLPLDWVVTHGDPNLANVIVGERGDHHVVDWSDVAIGPPERDLIFFTGDQFEAFLRSYLAEGGSANLHEDVFAFYQLRWTVQEIADYSTRILFRNVGPIEDEHAWDELRQYLPIQRDRARRELEQITRVIRSSLGRRDR